MAIDAGSAPGADELAWYSFPCVTNFGNGGDAERSRDAMHVDKTVRSIGFDPVSGPARLAETRTIRGGATLIVTDHRQNGRIAT